MFARRIGAMKTVYKACRELEVCAIVMINYEAMNCLEHKSFVAVTSRNSSKCGFGSFCGAEVPKWEIVTC